MRRQVTGVVAVLAAPGCLTAFPASAAVASPAAVAAVRTTTSMTARLDSAAAVTLTATVAAADGSVPAGAVQFEAGGSDVGSPVAVTGGRATTTAAVAAAGAPVSLTAVFTAVGPGYLPSAASDTEMLGPAAATSPAALALAAPSESGAFTVTIAPGTVDLAVSGLTATGSLADITVTDTRSDSPGWVVSGQDSVFTGSGPAAGWGISGNWLGWAPAAVGALQGGATLGGTVAPVHPGLGSTAAVLAAAAPGCGLGTNVLSASLTLAIPPSARAGPYTGTMTITYLAAGPQNSTCSVA